MGRPRPGSGGPELNAKPATVAGSRTPAQTQARPPNHAFVSATSATERPHSPSSCPWLTVRVLVPGLFVRPRPSSYAHAAAPLYRDTVLVLALLVARLVLIVRPTNSSRAPSLNERGAAPALRLCPGVLCALAVLRLRSGSGSSSSQTALRTSGSFQVVGPMEGRGSKRERERDRDRGRDRDRSRRRRSRSRRNRRSGGRTHTRCTTS